MASSGRFQCGSESDGRVDPASGRLSPAKSRPDLATREHRGSGGVLRRRHQGRPTAAWDRLLDLRRRPRRVGRGRAGAAHAGAGPLPPRRGDLGDLLRRGRARRAAPRLGRRPERVGAPCREPHPLASQPGRPRRIGGGRRGRGRAHRRALAIARGRPGDLLPSPVRRLAAIGGGGARVSPRHCPGRSWPRS